MMSSRTIKILNNINIKVGNDLKPSSQFPNSHGNGISQSQKSGNSNAEIIQDDFSKNDDDLINYALQIENILREDVSNFSESGVDKEKNFEANNASLTGNEEIGLTTATADNFDQNVSFPVNNGTGVNTEIVESVVAESTMMVEDPEWKEDSEDNASLTENEETHLAAKTIEDGEQSAVKHIDRRTRKKRRHVSRETWECNVQKRKRCEGVEYKGLKKGNGEWAFNNIRKARQLKPACYCKQSRKKSKLQCNQITEKQREARFTGFWRKSWPEKRECVKNLVQVETVKQRKAASSSSRRNNSLYCHLRTVEGLRIRVCKKQFLNTLGIGEWTMLSWVNNRNDDEKIESNESENGENTADNELNKDNNKKPNIENKTMRKTRATNHKKDAEDKFLKSFLESLPNMESHYCRSSSNKKYLEPIWTSKQQLYRFYKQECESKGIAALSSASFSNVFSDMNYSLFRPKKDQCDLCIGFRTGHIDELLYKEHLQKKDAARNEKSKDKEEAKWVFTMDLQSVLMAPKTNAGGMYYKSKLVIHNFTIFNLKNKDGYCYLWHEGQGGLSANEFSSILYSLLMNLNTEKGDEVTFYSDGCCYQNRNSTISNMFVLCSMQKEITIVQKYLEKGHTQMECDSMHSVIERKPRRKLRNIEIYTPAGYISVCKSARLKPRPYEVVYVSFDFFKSFSNLSFYKSIRPGYKKGDPQVTDLRCLRYKPSGSIEYKTDYNDVWQILPKRRTDRSGCSNIPVNLPRLYTESLKIDKKKFDNLQSLKGVLEKEFHAFYDTLQYKE